MHIPAEPKKLIDLAIGLAENCRVSQASRSSMYRDYQAWTDNGTLERRPATANLLYGHVDRLGSHLMSPTDLRFVVDTENEYDKPTRERCAVAGKVLTREWERQNIDMMFAHGVVEALKFGCVIPKLLIREVASGNQRKVALSCRLVMPWHFGVLDETRTALDEQEAVCETVYLTRYEIYRRVAHLPDGERLYKRIIAGAAPDPGTGGPDGFMHQVLLGAAQAPINPTSPMQAPGLVDVGGNQYPQPTVQVAEEMFPMHELYVRNDDQGGDYTTIQYIEPDILIAPKFRHCNLFVPDTLPYGYICPNFTPGRFWGRSEIQDLMEPQKLLTGLLDDYRKLMGMQFDKLFAFIGWDGITDEEITRQKNAGGFNMPPNSSVQDLTSKIPPEALPFVNFVVESMNLISGFQSGPMQGQAQGSIRSDQQANTMIRMGSPRLRDRSLLVERQLASFADASLSALEAKEAQVYWVNPEDGGASDFTMDQLPDDRRVAVDAHSSSPIYHDDNAAIMAAGFKFGYVTGDSMIEHMPYQNKDVLLARYHEKQKMEAQMLEKYGPALLKGKGGKR